MAAVSSVGSVRESDDRREGLRLFDGCQNTVGDGHPVLDRAVDTDASMAGLQAEFLDFRDRTSGRLELSQVRESLADGRFVWIDVDSREASASAVAEILPHDALDGLDLSCLEGVDTDADTVSSLRRSERLLLISLVGAVAREAAVATGIIGQSLHLIIGEGFLVTVHHGDSAVLQAVRREYLDDFRRHAATPSFLVYEFWSEQVDQFLRLQSRLEDRVEAMRLKLRVSVEESTLQELADVTGELLAFRKRVTPTRRVLEELVSRKTSLVSEATLGFLSRMVETLERLLSDIACNLGILESSMNFSLTLATCRTNQVMNRLAVVSTIFLPLTFLCGIYGMNFEGIPELEWSHGYTFFWGLSLAITVGLVVVLKRARLL